VIALDGEGRSLFVNAAARTIAGSNDGLSIDRGGHPFAFDRDANARLGELEQDVRAGGAGGAVRVPRAEDRPAYGIMVAPYFAGEGVDGGKPRPRGVIFVIHDPLRHAKPQAETIGTLFGLTPGMASLVAAIAAEEHLAAYAERVGTSMNTVHYT
jgi:hypothetical protein